MDWTDNYTENNMASSSSEEASSALSSIVKLWIAYCTMEISLRQFKQAVKIFEDAIGDPVVSRSADIYLAYVDYCKTRGKLSNAQKVYIKGLSSALAQEEADKLWASFLPFIQGSQGSPNLTMQQLFSAVTIEAGVGVQSLTPPGPGAVPVQASTVQTSAMQVVDTSASTSNSNTSTISVGEPLVSIKVEGVKIKIEGVSSSSTANVATIQQPSSITPEEDTRMILEESCVDSESKTDDSATTSSATTSSFIDNSPIKQEKIQLQDSSKQAVPVDDLKHVTLIKSEDVKMIISDHDTETAAQSVVQSTTTTSSDVISNPGGVGDDLDSVVGMTPEQLTRMYQHRPPMLFSAPSVEPTVFGLSTLSTDETTELEVFLGVSLTDIRYGERQNKVDAYLDLVEGLWTAQALKERHFDSWFTDSKKLHEKEVHYVLGA